MSWVPSEDQRAVRFSPPNVSRLDVPRWVSMTCKSRVLLPTFTETVTRRPSGDT